MLIFSNSLSIIGLHFLRLLASVLILIVPIFCFFKGPQWNKVINCFSFVIPTINFERLKILLVSLFFFIVNHIFLKQFVKLLMVKYTYLLISKVFTILCLLCLYGNREYPGSFKNKSLSSSFKSVPKSSEREGLFEMDKHRFILETISYIWG